MNGMFGHIALRHPVCAGYRLPKRRNARRFHWADTVMMTTPAPGAGPFQDLHNPIPIALTCGEAG